jgi:putative membrane protein
VNLNLVHNSLIAAHILAVIAWMAGLLYLPRLFVYHTRAAAGSELDTTLQAMEAKLYRFIMTPAMMVVWLLGLSLIWFDGHHLWGWGFLLTPWMVVKLAGVAFLTWWHHVLGRARKAFAQGQNTRSERFWRMTNELPFLAAIFMVVAIVTKFGDARFGG